MKIGVMSDTHDNVPMIRDAVKFFNDNNVEFLIHAGDFIAPFAVAPLDELKCDYIGVFGNNDGEKFGLDKRSRGKINNPPHSLELNNRKILILHEPHELFALAKSQVYDIIIYGHTHKPAIERHANTLVINPGECCGWLTGKSTVALISLEEVSAEIVELSA